MVLAQPVVLWTPTPLDIRITSVLISIGGTQLMVGTESGIVCFWNMNDPKSTDPELLLQPYCTLLGLTSGIIAMCECRHLIAGPSVCCLLADGALALCSLKDGRCLSLSSSSVVTIPTAAASLPGLTTVLVAADSCNLVVVDVRHLSVVTRISCTSIGLSLSQSRMWDPGPKSPKLLLSLTSSQQLQYWMVSEAIATGPSLSLVFHVDVHAPYGSPKACDQNDDQCRVALVVYSSVWMLFLFAADRPLCRVTAEEAPFSSGRFTSRTHFIIYSSSGLAHMYKLPDALLEVAASQWMHLSRNILGRACFSEDQSDGKANAASAAAVKHSLSAMGRWASATFGRAAAPSPSTPVPSTPTPPFGGVAWTSRYTAPSSKPLPSSGLDGVLQSAPYLSPLLSHTLDGTPDHLCFATSPPPASDPCLLVAASTTALSGWRWGPAADDVRPAWPACEVSGMWVRPAAGPPGFPPDCGPIPCTPRPFSHCGLPRPAASPFPLAVRHFSAEHALVVEGYADGGLRVHCASTRTCWTQCHAHRGRCTALHMEGRRLLSGCDEGEVHLWQWEESLGECRHIAAWLYHVAAVTHLGPLPPSVQDRTHAACFSLGADHTVVLYGCEALEPVRVLGGHSAPVRSLRWDVELDLCYAACHDGTLYAWTVSTGTLCRSFCGVEARDLLNRCGVRDALAVNLRLPLPQSHAAPPPSQSPALTPPLAPGAPAPAVTPSPVALASPASAATSEGSAADAVDQPQPTGLSPQARTALSYLFSGETDPSPLHVLHALAIPASPCPAPSFALSSHGETVVALAPRLAGGAERLAPLPMMLHAVATVACCYALSGAVPADTPGHAPHIPRLPVDAIASASLSDPSLPSVWGPAVRFFLARVVQNWDLDSVMWCVLRLESPVPAIQAAARDILHGILHSLDLPRLAALQDQLVALIMSPTPAWDPDVDSAAVLLAILCTVHARAPTPPHTPRATPAPAAAHEPPAERVTALVARALLEVAQVGLHLRVGALQLFAEQFAVWRPGLDMEATLRALLALVAGGGARRTGPKEVMAAAEHAFVTAAEWDLGALLQVLGKATTTVRNNQHAASILQLLMAIADRCPDLLYFYLLDVVRLIATFLSTSSLRPYGDMAVGTLLALQRFFNMLHVDAAKEYAALAVHIGVVFIFDLRAGRPVAEWPAHRAPVSCVRFSRPRTHLATYSDLDRCLRVWNLVPPEPTGFSRFLTPRLLAEPLLCREWEARDDRGDVPQTRQQPAVEWVGADAVRVLVPGQPLTFPLFPLQSAQGADRRTPG